MMKIRLPLFLAGIALLLNSGCKPTGGAPKGAAAAAPVPV